MAYWDIDKTTEDNLRKNPYMGDLLGKLIDMNRFLGAGQQYQDTMAEQQQKAALRPAELAQANYNEEYYNTMAPLIKQAELEYKQASTEQKKQKTFQEGFKYSVADWLYSEDAQSNPYLKRKLTELATVDPYMGLTHKEVLDLVKDTTPEAPQPYRPGKPASPITALKGDIIEANKKIDAKYRPLIGKTVSFQGKPVVVSESFISQLKSMAASSLGETPKTSGIGSIDYNSIP